MACSEPDGGGGGGGGSVSTAHCSRSDGICSQANKAALTSEDLAPLQSACGFVGGAYGEGPCPTAGTLVGYCHYLTFEDAAGVAISGATGDNYYSASTWTQADALADCMGHWIDSVPDGAGEPNDTMETATPMNLGTPIAGTISVALDYDYDFYVFTVPSGGRLVRLQTFDATGTSCSGVAPHFNLFDGGGTFVASAGDDADIPGRCADLTIALGAGTYYVGVAGLPPLPFGYVLATTANPIPTISFTATESEPNGDAASANGPYSTDQVIDGAIAGVLDTDLYAVQNAGGAPVTVHLETFVGGVKACAPYTDTELFVEDAGGTVLASDDRSGVNDCSALDYEIPVATTIYVRVTQPSGLAIPRYQLQIGFP